MRRMPRLGSIAVTCLCLMLGSRAWGQTPRFVLQWGSLGSADGQFGRIYDLAVDTAGIVYVADYTNNRIQTFYADGTYRSKWGSAGTGNSQFNRPFGIAIAPNGDVYVTDQSNHRIQQFASDGTFIRKWGSLGSGPGQLNYPAGIAVAPDGSVYVADYGNARVEKFNAIGGFLGEWGSYGTGPGQFGAPYAIEVAPTSDVFVVDSNNNRIARFTANGVFVGTWGSQGTSPGQFNFPTGVAISAAGTIFVSDHSNDRIEAFDTNGTFLYSWGATGSLPGLFAGPNGIVLDRNQDPYVADYSNARIEKFGFAGPPESSPTHWLVDPAGHGDFTTIEAALPVALGSSKDTILVSPGTYSGPITFPIAPRDLHVAAIGGASLTTLSGIGRATQSPTRWHLYGFKFPNDGTFDGFDFHGCDFRGVVLAHISLSSGNSAFNDCDFYGRTTTYGGVSGCRFHSAPYRLGLTASGSVGASNCTFEGPADTLVVGGGDGYDFAGFGNCVFRNAVHAAVFSGGGGFAGCRFEDISGNAIWYEQPCSGGSGTNELQVTGCRFERCGSAIRWITGCQPLATLQADTVVACTSDAITVSESASPAVTGYSIKDIIIEGAGGHGITARLTGAFRRVRVSNCRVQNVAGDGIRLVDEAGATDHTFASRLWNNRVDHAGGAGIRVQSGHVSLVGNLAWANGVDGIAVASLHPLYEQADSVVNNTSVGNGGAGIRMETPSGIGGVDQVVQRNVVASNAAGIQVATPFRGSVAFNDAFANSAGDFVGVPAPADSNLTLDPQFCDASLGDFGLQAASPCAPSGVYGLIGAKAVGCTANLGVGPEAPPIAFSAWPNPARGGAWFSAPAGVAGRVELVDLAGRRVWSRALRAGERVRWSGANAPGVYLARFTGGGTSRTVRLVWLAAR